MKENTPYCVKCDQEMQEVLLPKYEYEETNLSSLISSELQIFESAAKEKDIKLNVEIEKDPPSIHCDRNRLKQVLLNLVINAMDATERGGQVSRHQVPVRLD